MGLALRPQALQTFAHVILLIELSSAQVAASDTAFLSQCVLVVPLRT